MSSARQVHFAALVLVAGAASFTAIRASLPRPRGAPSAAPAKAGRVAPGQAAAAELLVGGLLDLNAATARDLEALPGIGPARAARIVELRQARGRFASVDELADVRGIGRSTLAKLRDQVWLGAEVAPSVAAPASPRAGGAAKALR